MPNIQVISRERHAGQRWKRYSNYTFAAADAVAALVVQELPRAMMFMPIGFLEVPGGGFMPMAVQGLNPCKNLFVARDGRWAGGYVPAAYRCYPFVLANTADGKQALCIDEDSGQLGASDGELFFGEDGQPSKAIDDALKFLTQVAANGQATQRICALLQKYDLIRPWPIRLQAAEGERSVEGLYRIDETAMNQLPAEAFIELRDAGALLLAYCQLLSMQHLPVLGKLLEAHAQADAQAAPPLAAMGEELDLSFLSEGGSLNFNGLW